MDNCRGCQASVRVRADALQRLLDVAHGAALVDAAEYMRRAALCRTCDQLAYGTTCLVCGCLLPVRARLAGKGCPDPRGPRW
ncbi:MAG TPA: hypothetical protein VGL77_03000 [Armatimonadota bacterium]|jgi:hypothetical protein